MKSVTLVWIVYQSITFAEIQFLLFNNDFRYLIHFYWSNFSLIHLKVLCFTDLISWRPENNNFI